MDKLKIIYIPADNLHPLPGNPRKTKDPDAFDKLKKLIEAHGFQNPLQVWKDGGKYYILCGNHRFDAGKELGLTEFPCLEYKGSREEALARAISDNKSSEWTEWDYPLLKDLLLTIDSGSIDIEITGFDVEEVESLINYFPELESQKNDKSTKSAKNIECPKCGHSFVE